jgi:hypothetical protein
VRSTALSVAFIVFGLVPHAGAQDTTAEPTAPSSASSTQSGTTRGFFTEPRPISEGLRLGQKYFGDDETGGKTRKSGFYPEMGNMVTGAGWISAGVGYRHWLGDRAFVDASTGLSWRAYKMAQARVEIQPRGDDRLAFGTQVRWQDLTQVNYYGDGPESLKANRSEYRLKSTNTIGYTTVRANDWLSVQGRVGWLSSPNILPPAGAFSRGNPPTYETFPSDPVHQLQTQPDFLHGEAAVVADTRDAPGYPRRGGVYRVSASRYADQDVDRFTFNRYEAEAAHFVPVMNDNIVFAFHGWVVGTTTAAGQDVPFYLAPSLGGSNTLRGFNDYRFHGRNLAVVNTEMRLALFEHVDAVALFEAGNVAPRFDALNLDKTSYGFGVRLHTDSTTLARVDVARSTEGWQFLFRMNDPFRFSRFNKRTAQAPFAP